MMKKRFSPAPLFSILALSIIPGAVLFPVSSEAQQSVKITTTTAVHPISYIESYVFQGSRSRSRTKSRLSVTDNLVVLPNLNEILAPTPLTRPVTTMVKAKATPSNVVPVQQKSPVPVTSSTAKPRFGYGSGNGPDPDPKAPNADPLVPIDPGYDDNIPVDPQSQPSQPQARITTPMVPAPGVPFLDPVPFPFSHHYSPRSYYYSTPFAPYPVIPFYSGNSCRHHTLYHGCHGPFSSRGSISLSRKSGLSFFFSF